MTTRVGVVLSGCGVFDGSEIHEAVSILIALDKAQAQAICLAPDMAQHEVIDHRVKKPVSGEKRSVLAESARIARGDVRDLKSTTADELDALVFPGGFGAAKNLCDFADKGDRCTVQPDVAKLLKDMHTAKKPIGLACISPVIAAKVLGELGLKPALTIGTEPATANAINRMGGEHHNVGPTEVHIDEKNRLVTTPCYMNNVGPWSVFQGAQNLVDAVLRMAR